MPTQKQAYSINIVTASKGLPKEVTHAIIGTDKVVAWVTNHKQAKQLVAAANLQQAQAERNRLLTAQIEKLAKVIATSQQQLAELRTFIAGIKTTDG